LQAPFAKPVFDAVVSKLRATTRSATSQSSRASTTASAMARPVPLGSLGTARSLATPSPDTSTGNRSTFGPPSATGTICPSQWTVRGTSWEN
jgi:hypothetical protein